MLLFFKVKAAPPIEPQESVKEGRERRISELLAELKNIDCRLDAIRDAMKKFRRDNCAMVNDGQVVFLSGRMTSAAPLENEWRDFQHSFAVLLQKRDAVLKEWSVLKTQKQKEVSHAN
jgi:hypothetical protein